MVISYAIEKYSVLRKATADNTQTSWDHNTSPNIVLQIDTVRRKESLQLAQIKELKIVVGKSVVERVSFDPPEVARTRFKAMVRGQTIGFRHVASDNSVKKYQLKFRHATECSQAAEYLEPFIVYQGRMQGVDSQLSQGTDYSPSIATTIDDKLLRSIELSSNNGLGRANSMLSSQRATAVDTQTMLGRQSAVASPPPTRSSSSMYSPSGNQNIRNAGTLDTLSMSSRNTVGTSSIFHGPSRRWEQNSDAHSLTWSPNQASQTPRRSLLEEARATLQSLASSSTYEPISEPSNRDNRDALVPTEDIEGFTPLSASYRWSDEQLRNWAMKTLKDPKFVHIIASQRQCIRRGIATADTAPKYPAPALGVNPAFDEALKVIAADKAERLTKLQSVGKELAKLKKVSSPSTAQKAQLATLTGLKNDIEVKAHLNDSEIRWRFDQGYVDMSQPVYRFLKHRHFSRQPKSKLMERVTQMRVIPDLLKPSFDPSVEVNLFFKDDSSTEPGVFLKTEDVGAIDLNSPDQENRTYQQYCHWLVANVPLSTTSPGVNVSDNNTLLSYIPPHPQRGTKYHRYTVIVYQQNGDGQLELDIANRPQSRERFDLGTFAETHKLQPVGVTFFRQVWSPATSSVYTDILKEKEPHYGRLPRIDPYVDETGRKIRKYVRV
ncbi:hypothetical protein BZG36_00307 [Bifiguratus adelaidae]|uniref:Uncharacterized protein n=1 Tax=Bifiguratus adelaidae TaxID=1938954 RepID=A0A261Y7V5_9FUNG|nr:hypothetical protein BZG36_00307 [Bifiguratus adelaidae]